jgi:microcystin-dependent protein
MTEPFLGEIRIASWSFPPKGWADCNGQLLPINQNQALFSLFGTTYGGDGRVNFALPDLRGRVPMHLGGGHTQGERAGEVAHTLSLAEIPTHQHAMQASKSGANEVVSSGNLLAVSQGNIYLNPAQSPNLTTLHPQSVTNQGGSQPHQNLQPFLTLRFIVALQGIFPSQT